MNNLRDGAYNRSYTWLMSDKQLFTCHVTELGIAYSTSEYSTFQPFGTEFTVLYSQWFVPLCMHMPWNENVATLTKFSSLAAPKVVKMTTFAAASDENLAKMTTFLDQCVSYDCRNK